MSKHLHGILALAAVAFIGLVAMQLVPLFKGPQFEITNESPHVVFVTVSWRDKSREVGFIEPSSTYVFGVDDEAAIKFTVRYPDGQELQSEDIYFTGGTVVNTTITENGIKVRYDFES